MTGRKEATDVKSYIANCLDAWMMAHPGETTVQDVLEAIESIREKMTEDLIKYGQSR